jgi:hypothetical protein
MRSWSRSTRPGHGSGITTCLLTCSGLSCAGGCRRNCPGCTGWPPDGMARTARSLTPSGTLRQPGTGRRHRLEVAIAALKLSLARQRGHLAGVIEQVRFLASPVSGQSGEDIALDSDLRAVALLNLGIIEAWALGSTDSQRHLREGADLARRIGRPYLEVACLAQLAFASKIEPFAPPGSGARRP